MSGIVMPGKDSRQVFDDACRLIEEKRATCLWFLAKDYRPADAAGIARCMRYIERYGDCESYKRARGIREWLSRNFKGASAD